MPNLTTYTLVFDPAAWHTSQSLEGVFERFAQAGYSVWGPLSSSIRGTRDDGMEDLSFNSIPAMLVELHQHGGLIVLWKDEQDLGVSIDHEYRQVSFGVGTTLYPERDHDLATSLSHLFTQLCEVLQPFYGYVTDELSLERAFPGSAFTSAVTTWVSCVAAHHPPPILVWRNFFCTAYLATIRPVWLETLAPQRTELRGGVLLDLAEHPWDARVAVFDQQQQRYQIVP